MAPSRNQSFTLDEVRASYSPGKAWEEFSNDLPVALIYRPLSFYVTVPLLALGVPTLAVTLFSGLLTIAMPVLAHCAGAHAYVYVALVAIAFHVLDCVDGNMARTRKAPSAVGAVVDGTVDVLFWQSHLLAMGMLAARETHALSPHALLISALSGVVVLVGRVVRNVIGVKDDSGSKPSGRPSHIGVGDWVVILFSGLEHVYAIGLLVAGVMGAMTQFVVAVAAYALLIAVVSVGMAVNKAMKIDGPHQ